MKSIAHPEIVFHSRAYTPSHRPALGIWSRFIDFAEKQQFNRLMWLALGVLGHGTVFTTGTMAVVLLNGAVFPLLAITCFSMVMVLIVNLAAMPTKITIPLLALSLLVDLAVIVTAILLR
jgi:hypothetical protein